MTKTPKFIITIWAMHKSTGLMFSRFAGFVIQQFIVAHMPRRRQKDGRRKHTREEVMTMKFWDILCLFGYIWGD